MKNNRKDFTVSVVIPAYNEEGNLEALTEKLAEILSHYYDYEILFVDDGSEDHTLEVLQGLQEKNRRIGYLSLSRNFGHQNALKAGLDHATGDCIITMDADLQHPPELIPRLIEKWQEGCEVVTTIRLDKRRGLFFKRKTSGIFYRLMNWLSDIHVPKGAADFRLLDRTVVDVLKDTKEYYLFFRGMTAWVGFRQDFLEYMPDKRFSGKSKYSFKRMLGFGLTGITSFSLKPLRLSILLGLFISILAFGYGVYAILMKFLTDQVVPGWTSVLASVLFIGGIQLVVLGIIAEYIGKLFMESKQRPHYIIRKKSRAQRRQYKNYQQERQERPNTKNQGQYPQYKTRRPPSRGQTYNRPNSEKSKKRKTGNPKNRSTHGT